MRLPVADVLTEAQQDDEGRGSTASRVRSPESGPRWLSVWSASAAFPPRACPEHEPGTVVAQIVGAQLLESDPFRDPQPHCAAVGSPDQVAGALVKIKALAGEGRQMGSERVDDKSAAGPPERSPPS